MVALRAAPIRAQPPPPRPSASISRWVRLHAPRPASLSPPVAHAAAAAPVATPAPWPTMCARWGCGSVALRAAPTSAQSPPPQPPASISLSAARHVRRTLILSAPAVRAAPDAQRDSAERRAHTHAPTGYGEVGPCVRRAPALLRQLPTAPLTKRKGALHAPLKPIPLRLASPAAPDAPADTTAASPAMCARWVSGPADQFAGSLPALLRRRPSLASPSPSEGPPAARAATRSPPAPHARRSVQQATRGQLAAICAWKACGAEDQRTAVPILVQLHPLLRRASIWELAPLPASRALIRLVAAAPALRHVRSATPAQLPAIRAHSASGPVGRRACRAHVGLPHSQPLASTSVRERHPAPRMHSPLRATTPAMPLA